MPDICYLTFEADVISDPSPSEKQQGIVYFLAKTAPVGKRDITIKIMLRGPAAKKIISKGDRIHITNGNVYVADKSPDYLFNVAVEKEQFIHVVSYDDGVKSVEKLTGGF